MHGVDGSEAMLRYSSTLLDNAQDVRARVELFHGMLPGAKLPRTRYDAVISNSLLHHLPDPHILWNTLKDHATSGAPVFVMDLVRPVDEQTVKFLSAEYAANEPNVLRTDFENSLRAAFTPDEVQQQLEETGLAKLNVEQISDRHMIIYGTL